MSFSPRRVVTATDPEGARGKMLQAASTGRQSLAGMRRLLGVLRADDGGDRAPQPDLGSLTTGGNSYAQAPAPDYSDQGITDEDIPF